MTEQIITVRFEIHEGDVTPHFLWPLPHTGIMEVLRVTFTDGQWEVTSTKEDAPAAWVGRDAYRNAAILNFLKARLGLYEGEPGQP